MQLVVEGEGADAVPLDAHQPRGAGRAGARAVRRLARRLARDPQGHPGRGRHGRRQRRRRRGARRGRRALRPRPRPRRRCSRSRAELGSDVPFALLGGTAIGTRPRHRAHHGAGARHATTGCSSSPRAGCRRPRSTASATGCAGHATCREPERARRAMAALRAGDAGRARQGAAQRPAARRGLAAAAPRAGALASARSTAPSAASSPAAGRRARSSPATTSTRSTSRSRSRRRACAARCGARTARSPGARVVDQRADALMPPITYVALENVTQGARHPHAARRRHPRRHRGRAHRRRRPQRRRQDHAGARAHRPRAGRLRPRDPRTAA